MNNKPITREEQIIKAATSHAKWGDSQPTSKCEMPNAETAKLIKEEEVVLKGFVAVDNGGDKMTWNPSGRRVVLFEKKPFRDTLTRTHYWASPSPYGRIKLNWDSFSHMSWNDEPIEVELKVTVTKKKE